MANKTLKEELTKLAGFYERSAENMKWREERMTDGNPMKQQVHDAYKYHCGQLHGIREALKIIEEYIG